MTGKDNHPLKIIPKKRKIITIQFPIFVAINKEIKNKDFFKDYQMNEVDSFDILLWAYDNAKSFKAFDSGQIHADVAGTTVVSSPVFDSAQNLYNQNGISVDFISSAGNSFTFCITNTTGQYFAYDVTSETYNDFTMSDSYEVYNEYLLDGCKTLITLTPTDEFLAANGISDVSNVDFALTIRPLAEFANEYTTDLISYQNNSLHKYRKAKSRGFYSPALFMAKPAFTITFPPQISLAGCTTY